jgi:HEAT repeat protein
LSTADSPEIRDALAGRLGDSLAEVVDEAVAGLARRRDARALPLLLERLRQDDVDDLTIEAAGEMLGMHGGRGKMAAEDYISALQLRFMA